MAESQNIEYIQSGITWDSVPIPVGPEVLRFDAFDIFKERAVKSSRISAENINIDNIQLLDSLNLIEGSSLKRAGVLLFHHNPGKWIPGCYIKIGYFSSETEIVYQDELHGSLLNQAELAVDLIYTKYLKGIISYEGVLRVETYPYPREAIREAVLNAIAHKNYSALIPIQIKVYPDKLSISNDCVFPEEWTMEDFLGKHRSRPYNPLIANAFYRAGFIESWGRGIEKIKEACQKSGNKEPEFKIKRDELTVIFEAKEPVFRSNELIEAQKELFEEANELIEEEITTIQKQKEAFQKRINELNAYSKSKTNLVKIFDSFYQSPFFGRKDIMSICDVNINNAGKLIDKLKACDAIEPVARHGKGKYCFKKYPRGEEDEQNSD